jgi:NADP-dependent 3-hydroxy acid dehydrogenase YdfG
MAFLARIGCDAFEIDDDLKERHFGDYEGKLVPPEFFSANYPSCQQSAVFSQAVGRALNHVDRPGMALISHGGLIRAAATHLNVKLLDEQVTNGCVVHFQRTGSSWSATTYPTAVALVSNAISGIGLAVAQELIKHGYRVSLGAHDVGKLEIAFGQENEFRHYASLDTDQLEQCEQWVTSTVEKFGRIDSLVVNDSIRHLEKLEVTSDDHEGHHSALQTHLGAPASLTRLCLPHLEKTGVGRIVHINQRSDLRLRHEEGEGPITAESAQIIPVQTPMDLGRAHNVRMTSIVPGRLSADLRMGSECGGPQGAMSEQTVAEATRLLIELSSSIAVDRLATIPGPDLTFAGR